MTLQLRELEAHRSTANTDPADRSDAQAQTPFDGLPRRRVDVPFAALTLILLLLLVSRITRLDYLDFQKDEVWSVWQTLGTLRQTVEWTPYDWSPAYYLTVHAWRVGVGISPFALRLYTVFTLLVTAALLYVVARKLTRSQTAGLLAVLAFGAMGYSLFLSTILRAYQLNLALFLLALWLTLRLFERPSRLTAVGLALVCTLSFYIHVTAIFAFAMLAVMSLILYRLPIRDWLLRWLLPGAITAALCLPEALAKLSVIPIKNRIVEMYIPYVPPPIRLYNHYLDYAGQQGALFAALFLVAGALLLDRWRVNRRMIALIGWMLAPVVVLIVGSAVDAFNPRHIPWVMLAFAVWIGWGLAMLPRPAVAALSVVLGVAMFDHIPIRERYETVPRVPLHTTFNVLQTQFRNGDVIFRDPVCKGCAPADPEEWDYFTRAYFPHGLTLVDSPNPKYDRVWYVAAKGQEDPDTLATLEQTRALSRTLGQDDLLFRLYEAPPDPTGVLFANGMRFHGAEVLNEGNGTLVWHEGETVRLRLWWSIDSAVTLDYSVGTYILNADSAVIGQTDGPPTPLNGPKETSRWITGRVYLEEREVKLPLPLATGDQQVALTVYQWWDGQKVGAPGLTADSLLILRKIYVKSL